MNSRSSHKNDSCGGSSSETNIKWDELKLLAPLRTKLYIPPLRSGWFSRPRLDKRMDQGFEGKLPLISAPAGFGKTTLLVDWIHRRKIATAWFSVDKGDNDPLHFLTYVILGLQSLEADIGKAALTILQSPQPPPIEPILINLLNDVIRMFLSPARFIPGKGPPWDHPYKIFTASGLPYQRAFIFMASLKNFLKFKS